MPIATGARERLADAMEQRRLALNLRWQDVSEQGGVSIKALHDARRGHAGISPLTRRGIERGLQWPAGEVGRLLGDGPDAQLELHPEPAPAPRPKRGTFQVLPGDEGVFRARGESVNIRAMSMVAGVLGPDAAELRTAIDAAGPGATGTQIFDDPILAKLWDMDACSQSYRLMMMSAYLLRRRAAAEAETARQSG